MAALSSEAAAWVGSRSQFPACRESRFRMPQRESAPARQHASALSDRDRLRGIWTASASLVALAGVAVVLAGCAGSSSLTVANISGVSRSGRHVSPPKPGGSGVLFAGVAPSPAQRAANEVAALLFSRCMRAHGVPNYPDPAASSGYGIGFGFGSAGIDPAAPLFRVAQRKCISILIRRRSGPG